VGVQVTPPRDHSLHDVWAQLWHGRSIADSPRFVNVN
jgi:hypothetical protein